MDKNTGNDTEKSKYPERSSALQSELVKTAGYNAKNKPIEKNRENAIGFHFEQRNYIKKRPYRSIPNAIWTLFCLRRIQPENRTNTI